MPSPAKITAPAPPRLISRPRLLRALGPGLVWVAGPPGAGKTCLALDLLRLEKPRHLWYRMDAGDGDPATLFAYLGEARRRLPRSAPLPRFGPEVRPAVFARRFFEALYAGLPAGSTLVFDDFHELAPDSPTLEILKEGFSLLPEGLRILVLSRQAPPPAFARLQAHGHLRVLGWERLEWSRRESESLVRAHLPAGPARRSAAGIYGLVGGWAAGLVLLSRRQPGEAAGPGPAGGSDREVLFDYFASEVLAAMAPRLREVLLAAAVLPRCSASQAQALSGHGDAGACLRDLARAGCFTLQRGAAEPVFEFHPLFRHFLQQRGRAVFPAETYSALERKGAVILEASGEVEAAAGLLAAAGDWEGLGALIERHAPALLRQGRTGTLEGWIARLPVSVPERRPWLRHWQGVCLLATDLARSGRCFACAFEAFEADGDPAGSFLSWCGCVDAVLYAWDDFHPLDGLIAWLDGHEEAFRALAGSEVEACVVTSMIGALVQRRPDHPRMGVWVAAAFRVLREAAAPRLRSQAGAYLIAYAFWTGDNALIAEIAPEQERMARAPEASAFCVLNWHFTQLVRLGSFQGATPSEHLAFVREALEYSAREGIHLLDFMLHAQAVIAAGLAGDLAEARRSLGRMADVMAGRNGRSFCHYLSAWVARLEGDLSSALLHARRAVEASEESGMLFSNALVLHGHAELLFDAGRRQEARRELDRAAALGRRVGGCYFQALCGLAGARFALAEGGDPLGPLRSAMEAGRRGGFLNVYWWIPDEMSRLFSLALGAGLEPDYVRRVIRARRLRPEGPARHAADWPWPLRIRTLGAFSILREGVPLEPKGKAPRKALLLLQAIVAAGRKGARETLLADWLWPDAEGDTTLQALNTCLHRLRQFLAVEGAVVLRHGRLSLDRERCWVDAHAFESLLEAGEAAWDSARALYGGHFLEDVEEPWASGYRDHLEGALRKTAQRAATRTAS
jgi:hypothetical protein